MERFSGSRLLLFVLFLISAFCFAAVASAQIYKYKDQNGNWCFTNDPSKIPVNEQADEPTKTEEPAKTTSAPSPGPANDLAEKLQRLFPPKNKIESARNATVMIRTSMGTGSGFFVSTKGYILTNKHVLPGTPERQDELRKREILLTDARANLDRERSELSKAKEEIEANEKQFQGRTRQSRQTNSLEIAKHNERVQIYNRKMMAYQAGEQRYAQELKNLEDLKQKLSYGFDIRIVLVDGSELPATIIAMSSLSDLALLKVYAGETPSIESADLAGLPHGATLYAIGCPMGASFRHSVTSGAFSGLRKFEEGSLWGIKGEFVQTSAPINEGNSGGPLVDEQGKAVGVNTWIIRKGIAEGMGFAIPISSAMEEFKSYLQNP